MLVHVDSAYMAVTMQGDLCAAVHETHTGLVMLIGDQAFKAKKPVITDFLDFSTADLREHACRREVELNRRLAPASYLGVGRFTQPRDGAGEPVIVMRRYSDSARLASLVRSGESVHEHLAAIADTLARFHKTAARGSEIDEQATVTVLSARWHENLNELRRHVGSVIPREPLDEITRLADQFLAGRAALFARRIADGRVVDGHGDLLSEDIFCLPDGPVLLDCLEFDDQLRYLDGIDDAAFLAMDLNFLGRQDLADFFLGEYVRLADDAAPQSFRHFCVAYRAVVRAKVDCIRVLQGHGEASLDAHRHIAIAVEHLRRATVQLIVIRGGPGTGKTTLAHALAERIGAHVISTDDVRRELQRSGVIAGRVGDLHAGLYSSDNVAAVYDEVLRRAESWLSSGSTVILDGTWRDTRQWGRAHRLAVTTASPVVDFTCSLPLEEAAERITARAASASDATPQIAAALNVSGAEARSHSIDTARPIVDSVDEAQRICCLSI
jgi:aminoglycoside phosphotransferase family enzyme/predicted kinase